MATLDLFTSFKSTAFNEPGSNQVLFDSGANCCITNKESDFAAYHKSDCAAHHESDFAAHK